MRNVEDYARQALQENVLSKRAKIVVQHLLDNGHITTEEIEKIGYAHAPRAARDVREAGIPITTKMVSHDGKRMAQYTFGDPNNIEDNKLGGRVTFPKKFKDKLLKIQGNRCAICNQQYDEKYLQIDHRVPYEYNGDSHQLDVKDYMLLCAECDRKKDRATEVGCKKTCFKTNDLSIIRSCFWASPENYTHICMKPIRRLDLAWFGENDVQVFDEIKKRALIENISLQELVKRTLAHDFDSLN